MYDTQILILMAELLKFLVYLCYTSIHLKAFRTDLQPPSEVGSEDPGEHPQANATLVLSSQT